MTKTKIIYCCKDCGNLICLRTALYGNGRCRICANLGILNPSFDVHRCGINNFNWKKGKPHCLDCNKLLANYRSRRCEKCFSANRKNKPRGGKPRFGKNAPSFKHGLSITSSYCLDCKTEISWTAKRCYDCWAINNSGKNNACYVHGQGYKQYPLEFNKRLKKKIRKRDNYICQNCGMMEEKHHKLYNKNLTIHHIDYNKENCKEDNLITACHKCNIKANFNRDYWYAYFRYIMEAR